MAGMNSQHWLLPDWEPGLTIAHLPHFTGLDIRALVIDVDRTLLPGKDVQLPEAVRVWLIDAQRRRSCIFSAITLPEPGSLRWPISLVSASPAVRVSHVVVPYAA